MRLFVLGATGRTGTQVLDLALARGHQVTGFGRSPQKLAPRPGLTVAAGDPRSVAAIRAALPGHDAVISAIGAPTREALRPSTLMTDCMASAVAAMTAVGVPRLALVSAAVLFPEPSGFPFDLFRWLLSHHMRDLTTMEAVATGSELAFTVARPPRLTAGADPTYRAVRNALPERAWSTTYRSVAAFLLDAIEQGAYRRDIVGVAR